MTPIDLMPSRAEPPPSAAPAETTVAPLRAMLARLRRQAKRWIWIETLSLICLWGAAVFLVSLWIDWMIEPPWEIRAAIVGIAAIGFGWLVMAKLAMRLAAPLDDPQLALLVERTHPHFEDSLSTAIELSQAARSDTNAVLLVRTAAVAIGRLGEVRPAAVFRQRSLGMLAAVGCLAAAGVAGLVAGRPDVAQVWMSRMLLFDDTPWPRRVRLEAEGFVDGVRIVARGTDVDVLVLARGDHTIPDIVDMRSRGVGPRGRGWRTERMGTRGGRTPEGQVFGHVMKAVGESLDLEIRGGDARLRPLRLEVVDAPAMESLAITATLPEYLGKGTRRVATSRVVAVPRGSDVEIACAATKPLSHASLSVVVDGVESKVAEIGAEAADPPTRLITARLDNVESDRTVVVHFTDRDGLVNRDPISFVISTVPDEPPQVAVRLRGISTAVTSRARIPIEGTIADDHGLAEAAVSMLVQPADAPAREASHPVERVRPGLAMVELPADAAEVVMLEPLAAALGSRLSITVTAVDGCMLEGGPNRAAGDTWTLDVVAPEALQAMLEAREVILRRRFESVVADVTQARDGLASSATESDLLATAMARLVESAGRAAGETTEIATAFREIRLELDNNGLLTPEVDTRLIRQIADPLTAIAIGDLPVLAAAGRAAGDPAATREALLRRADAVLARMRSVLDMMMELESFNEVIERLRGVIRTQEQIRQDTLEQQKRRAREALEGL